MPKGLSQKQWHPLCSVAVVQGEKRRELLAGAVAFPERDVFHQQRPILKEIGKNKTGLCSLPTIPCFSLQFPGAAPPLLDGRAKGQPGHSPSRRLVEGPRGWGMVRWVRNRQHSSDVYMLRWPCRTRPLVRVVNGQVEGRGRGREGRREKEEKLDSLKFTGEEKSKSALPGI